LAVTGGSVFCLLNNQRETKKFGMKEGGKTEGRKLKAEGCRQKAGG
jgi:hypothetical protein